MTRQRWSSRTIFLLAALGSALGLGNVWRFPYLAGKYGGGAFLIPYLIALVVLGVPMLILEFAVGQKMQRGAIESCRKLHASCASLGIFALLTSFIICAYYVVVMAWCLVYFLASFQVPWAGNAKNYFFQTVLQVSDHVGNLGGFNGSILFALMMCWIAIYFCVWRGTQSVGKVVLYSVPLPILLLGILLIRTVTLPGFLEGWRLYLSPVWSSLLDREVWTAAFSQTFYTLSLGFGIMIVYGSYKDEKADIAKDTWLTTIFNTAISLLAGFVVFGVLGYMAWKTQLPLQELAASGPGLAFVVFPEALSLMPFPGVFSALFFLMLLSLAIDSAFSLVEALNATFLDLYPRWKLAQTSFWVCLAGFAAGLIFTTRAGLYFLDIADHFTTHYNLMLVGLFQVVLVGWLYGAEQFRRYINAVSDWPIGKWWNFSIKFIIPVVLVALLSSQLSIDLKTPYEGYPAWALGIGWSLVLLPLGLFVMLVWRDRQREEQWMP